MNQTTGKARARKLNDEIEALWDNLLSRQPGRIRAAYATLDSHEQQAVVNHLQRMASENGWQPEQSLSAQAALRAIVDQS